MKEQSSNAGLNRVARRMAMFLCCVLLFEGLLIAVAPGCIPEAVSME